MTFNEGHISEPESRIQEPEFRIGLWVFIILDNFVQAEAVNVSFHLYPDGHVVGELKAEFVEGVLFAREQFVDDAGARVEVERAAGGDRIFRDCRQMQDLVVPGVVENV